MIDHISLRVSDFQPDRERIWIGRREGGSHGYAHIAVLAKDRATVCKFYEAAMSAGGRDNGGAGPRPNYSPTWVGTQHVVVWA